VLSSSKQWSYFESASKATWDAFKKDHATFPHAVDYGSYSFFLNLKPPGDSTKSHVIGLLGAIDYSLADKQLCENSMISKASGALRKFIISCFELAVFNQIEFE
jgi:hypothetical protein